MRLKNIVLTGIVSVLSIFHSSGQIELPEDKVKWKFSVEQDGCEAFVVAKITVIEHWHINATKLPEGSFGFATAFNVKKSPDFQTVGGVIEPKPINVYDELADEHLSYHEGTFTLKRKIKILSDKDFEISGNFHFQTCNDVKCLPDHNVEFKLKVKGCSEAKTTQEDVTIDETKLIDIKNDEAKDKEGNSFVKVNNKWHKVPEGNSTAFYKKYLLIIEKDEE